MPLKIKRKPPKPAKGGRPAFVVGWSFSLPTITDLKFWFDLEYGGPLKIAPETGTTPSSARLTLSHALWSTSIICPLPEDEARLWQDQLQWGHAHAAAVLQRQAAPAQTCDTQLFLRRLARGLALLSEGTSYDVQTESFQNPSDWKDRPLTTFLLEDHVTVVQSDTEDPTSEWFRTMGLSKFGLDELETARPRGLASRPTIDMLLQLSAALIQTGHNPKVGTTIVSPLIDLPVQVVSHRTVPRAAGPLPVRQVRW